PLYSGRRVACPARRRGLPRPRTRLLRPPEPRAPHPTLHPTTRGTRRRDHRPGAGSVEEEAFRGFPRRARSERSRVSRESGTVKDFVARLPEALRADVRLGREFLRETLRYVRVADAGHRQRICPICSLTLGKVTPQHLSVHGVALRDGYRRFPELGFTKGARLTVQPSPEGLLNTGEVFGLVVAGVGFEPTTFGL